MRFSGRVKKIGTGFFILIPATVRNEKKIIENSFVECSIEKIDNNNITEYK